MSRKESSLSVCKCNQKSEMASVYVCKFPFRRPESPIRGDELHFSREKSPIFGQMFLSLGHINPKYLFYEQYRKTSRHQSDQTQQRRIYLFRRTNHFVY